MPKITRAIFNPFLLGALHSLSFFSGAISPILLPLIQWLSFTLFTIIVYKTESLKSLFTKATVFGTTSFSISLYWLYISMHNYGNMPGILAAITVVLFSFYLSWFLTIATLIFGYLKKRAINHHYKQAHFVLPLLWAALVTLAELGRGYLFTGFPWNNIAYAYVDSPFHSWAAIGGAYSVSFVVAFFAGMTALFILSRDKRREFALIIAFISLISVSVMAQWIPWSSPKGLPMTVRLVQGNVDQHEKFDRDLALDSVIKQIHLAELPPTDPAHPPQAVIFPETIIPAFQNQMPIEIWNRILRSSSHLAVPLYVGSPLYSKTPNNPARMTNGLMEITPHTALAEIYDGNNNLNIYNKRHLVPFGEFIPFGFNWFVEAMSIPLGNFDRGTINQNNFVLGDQVLAPNICYEDIFGEELIGALFTRGNNNPGANILFNIGNLAWFGDTIALHQQLQQSRMRSMETARPMLRATNTGITALINEKGEVKAQLPTSVSDVLDVSVQGTEGFTWYARMGNLPIFMLSLVIVILFWLLKCNPFFSFSQTTTRRLINS